MNCMEGNRKQPTTTTIKKEDGSVVIKIEMGDVVLCDSCNADCTESTEPGGSYFHGKALCPECTPQWIRTTRSYGEEGDLIMNRTGKSFADWVREDLR